MNHVPYQITESGIVLLLDNEQLAVPTDHPNYGKIKAALRAKRYDGLRELVDVRAAVQGWLTVDRAFTLVNDRVSFQGREFSETITNKVLNMINAGNSASALFNFLRKVRLNPSATAQDELLLFCEANDFLIDEDGDVIAYKKVREDYTDSFTGTIDNSVGQIVRKNRNEVDDNRDRTCSFGLHFAAFDYARDFTGSHLMVIKLNPRDVVSIPSDYHNQKGRCCEYRVVAELVNKEPLPKREVYNTSGFGMDGYRDEDFNDDMTEELNVAGDSGHAAGRVAAQRGEVDPDWKDYLPGTGFDTQDEDDAFRDAFYDAFNSFDKF